MQDDKNNGYHDGRGHVHKIQDGVQAAEDAGIPLDQIHHALICNRTATVIALMRVNIATLRALTEEAQP
jgi:hypothetical protein